MRQSMKFACCVLTGAWMILGGTFNLYAEVKPASIFASHMVLQRGKPVPVWGTASGGEQVVVSFNGQEKMTKAEPSGAWMVKLDPMKEGGPFTLKIGGLAFEDVLIGEVWLGAGQSNMAIGSTGVAKNDPVLAEWLNNSFPEIRIAWGAKGDWRVAKTGASFPALPYAFAVNLRKQLNVPVGIVVGAVPGSSTDFWLMPQAVQADEACRAAIRTYAESLYPRLQKEYQARLKKWEAEDAAAHTTKKPEPPLEPGAATHPVGKFFEAHIRPVIPFAIRGVLWDQGENGPSITGTDRCMVMRALITSWRREFGQGDLPWIYVQKPSGGGCAWDPANPMNRLATPFSPLPEKMMGSGALRAQFVNLLNVPNAFMVITSDLSPGLHPPNKSGYGCRAAEIAMVAAYGRKAEISGPLYASHKIEGGRMRITFTHIGKGLAIRHGAQLQGFAVAGENRRFVWADAVIEGETVLLSSPSVPNPVAARYAWDEKCAWANLFNQDGLPAQTFRTDSW